jgi:hypothetical protein
MDLIHQNANGILSVVQATGCFFVSAITLAEIQAQKSFSAAQVNALWSLAAKKGWVADGNIKQSAPIASAALQELGCSGRFVEVGTRSNEGAQIEFYGSVADNLRRADALIRKIRQPKGSPYPYHFKVVDESGGVVFDPWAPNGIRGSTVYDIIYAFIG